MLLLRVPDIQKDARTIGGNTPLMLAAQAGDLESVNALLEAGANPFIENGLR